MGLVDWNGGGGGGGATALRLDPPPKLRHTANKKESHQMIELAEV